MCVNTLLLRTAFVLLDPLLLGPEHPCPPELCLETVTPKMRREGVWEVMRLWGRASLNGISGLKDPCERGTNGKAPSRKMALTRHHSCSSILTQNRQSYKQYISLVIGSANRPRDRCGLNVPSSSWVGNLILSAEQGCSPAGRCCLRDGVALL